ncbi:putative brix domain-containing protein [Neospora caninum Liverpool]|uniref:Ribosome production factor 2 homolog n=1 Tax=Neospora caninum (strain Liverpool) TaxID=572307 RepID=F0VIA1_NEOCL|nr:putative brix domain-containing protein [Neospora caninum Liverpool]CBZ53462.1 putative brix domain-containing protein [Neospora caninum Liverpool]CEL67449.1 TPA: brix domain-containing protein, putative [Neospora caninum Liverpool]|eukprot:XP_003883494.1 putative brix domain-containing protein [Neospora caninum Liverpool]
MGVKGLNLAVSRVAKTRRGKQVLKARGPQVHEPTKRLLVMKGNKASQSVQNMLADLRDLKKPDAVYLHSRNQKDFHPFEDVSTGEYLCQKNDCGTFCLGSSSKKRPNRLIFGRMFANELLDMYEFQVVHYMGSSSFAGVEKPRLGGRPLLLLQGAAFESTEVHRGLRNILADIFRGGASHAGAVAGEGSAKLYLKGIDRVVAITALERDGAEAHLSRKVHLQTGGSTATVEGAANAAVAATLPVPGAEKKDDLGSGSSLSDKTATGGKPLVCLRQYRLVMQRGEVGSKVPRVELVEVGPQIDMVLDRHRVAETSRWKRATKTRETTKAADSSTSAPKAEKNKKRKNVTTTTTGDVIGRVFVDKPDWKSLDAQKNVLLIKHNRKRQKLANANRGGGAEENA